MTMPTNTTTAEAIAATLDQVAAVTESFSVHVPAEDFRTWVEELGKTHFAVNRQKDLPGAHAHVAGYRNGTYVQVHCVAEGIADHDLPDREAKDWWLDLPVAEAAKLFGVSR